MVKASASRAADLGLISAFSVRIFSGSSHTRDLKHLVLQWLPCQAPGVIGSMMGLVGPVSILFDWVRWKV